MLFILLAGCSTEEPTHRVYGTSKGTFHALTPFEHEEDSSPEPSVEEPSEQEDDWPQPQQGDCGFGYYEEFQVSRFVPTSYRSVAPSEWRDISTQDDSVDQIAYVEPKPDGYWRLISATDNLTMPSYNDDMPLFERADEWDEDRCFETPLGQVYLSESQAYDLYRDIIEKTTGSTIDTSDGARSILGIRGAWPGTFAWHGNMPNRFNDTLVVLWRQNGQKNVREFPVNTDTGDYYFGYHSSSSLKPNRRYSYKNGWHSGYNAIQIQDWGYLVQDDSNGNGHWDSDRNGWLDGGNLDHERTGSGHNIHLASVDAPLGTARIQNWSAGCQTIPGIENWTQFLDVVWEDLGTDVSYYLVDSRDIAPDVWQDCEQDGSHSCPYEITSFPFVDTDDTITGVESFDYYNCSGANESGPEIVYMFTTEVEGWLSVSVESDEGVDVDIHLLEANDPDTCRERGHISFDSFIGPGRYFIVADSWVDDDNVSYAGGFTLHVDLD